MRNTLIRAIALLLCFIMILESCTGNSNREKDPVEKAEDNNQAKFDKIAEQDAQSLVDAYTGSLYALKVAEAAKVKASSQQAKDLAIMIAEAHAAENDQIRILAGQKQISLPADLSPEESDKIVKMNQGKGLKYDKDFAGLMVAKHTEALNMYSKCSGDCSDADIRSWFTAALPALQKHLDTAVAIKEIIDKMR